MPSIKNILKTSDLQNATLVQQAAAVQDTWYTILSEDREVRLHMIRVSISIANEDLEIRITTNGKTFTGSNAGSVAGTNYYIYLNVDGTLTFTTTITMAAYSTHLDLRDCLLELRKTSNNGAGTLTGRVEHGAY